MTTNLELARGSFLRPNGLGGYIIRQSDISSWDYCQLRKFYEDRADANPEAPQPAALSRTEYGSVLHYVVMQMETMMIEGREDALKVALALWDEYWHPDNMLLIPGVRRITEWLPRETYGGLRDRGKDVLKLHHAQLVPEKSWPLALEYEFAVPMEIAGRTHTLTGTVDRLSIRAAAKGKPYISLDDNKAGKRYTYLRYNTQGGFYAYATTTSAFWLGWPDSGKGALETFGDDLMERVYDLFAKWGYSLHKGSHSELPLASRRFRWIDLREVKFIDGGWRTEQDYARLMLAVDAYIRSCEAEIYSVNTAGEICRYCSFKDACGGVGLPKESAGAP